MTPRHFSHPSTVEHVDIKIGVRNISRELNIETDVDPGQLEGELTQALATGDGVWRIEGAKGRIVYVPVSALGYVEVNSEQSRPVGFGTN